MKWLHLSDLHYNPKKWGVDTSYLISDLKKYIAEKKISAEHVFYTGDFRYAPDQKQDTAEGDAQAAADQLVEISRLAGVTKSSNIHIVPGNHDLDRWDTALWDAATRTDESAAELDKKAKKTIDDILNRYNNNNGRFSGKVRHYGEFSYISETEETECIEYLTHRFSFFKLVSEKLSNTVWTAEDALDKKLHCAHEYEGKYNIAYLNTAIASGYDGERGNLVIGYEHLSQALEGINADLPGIALGHHGLENFRVKDRERIIEEFQNSNIKLYFCGDEHESVIDPFVEGLQLTAGCLTVGNNVEPTFYVGSMDEAGIPRIEAHKYDSGAYHGWSLSDPITKIIAERLEKIYGQQADSFFFDRVASNKRITNS